MQKPIFEPVKNPVEIKAFGAHLRFLRDKANLTQQQLADRSGLSKMTIQRVENGTSSVTLDSMITIADALNISLKKLVDHQ